MARPFVLYLQNNEEKKKDEKIFESQKEAKEFSSDSKHV